MESDDENIIVVRGASDSPVAHHQRDHENDRYTNDNVGFLLQHNQNFDQLYASKRNQFDSEEGNHSLGNYENDGEFLMSGPASKQIANVKDEKNGSCPAQCDDDRNNYKEMSVGISTTDNKTQPLGQKLQAPIAIVRSHPAVNAINGKKKSKPWDRLPPSTDTKNCQTMTETTHNHETDRRLTNICTPTLIDDAGSYSISIGHNNDVDDMLGDNETDVAETEIFDKNGMDHIRNANDELVSPQRILLPSTDDDSMKNCNNSSSISGSDRDGDINSNNLTPGYKVDKCDRRKNVNSVVHTTSRHSRRIKREVYVMSDDDDDDNAAVDEAFQAFVELSRSSLSNRDQGSQVRTSFANNNGSRIDCEASIYDFNDQRFRKVATTDPSSSPDHFILFGEDDEVTSGTSCNNDNESKSIIKIQVDTCSSCGNEGGIDDDSIEDNGADELDAVVAVNEYLQSVRNSRHLLQQKYQEQKQSIGGTETVAENFDASNSGSSSNHAEASSLEVTNFNDIPSNTLLKSCYESTQTEQTMSIKENTSIMGDTGIVSRATSIQSGVEEKNVQSIQSDACTTMDEDSCQLRLEIIPIVLLPQQSLDSTVSSSDAYCSKNHKGCEALQTLIKNEELPTMDLVRKSFESEPHHLDIQTEQASATNDSMLVSEEPRDVAADDRIDPAAASDILCNVEACDVTGEPFAGTEILESTPIPLEPQGSWNTSHIAEVKKKEMELKEIEFARTGDSSFVRQHDAFGGNDSDDEDSTSVVSPVDGLDDLITQETGESLLFDGADIFLDHEIENTSAQTENVDETSVSVSEDIVDHQQNDEENEKDLDPEDMENRKCQAMAISDLLKNWGASAELVKHAQEATGTSSGRKRSSDVVQRGCQADNRVETDGNESGINTCNKQAISLLDDTKSERNRKEGKTVAFSASLEAEKKVRQPSSKARRSKTNSRSSALATKTLPAGMTLVKIKRHKLPASLPKLVGGLALIENNETMKGMSQIEYSRKLWVDMQMNANQREWEHYKKALQDGVTESEKVVSLIHTLYISLNQYSEALDTVCRDVYIGSDGQPLVEKKRAELEENGYVCESLRSSMALNPIVQSLNRLKDELDHYVPLMEATYFKSKSITEEVVARVEVLVAHGQDLVQFKSIQEAEKEVQKTFGALMMSIGSFSSTDNSKDIEQDRWFNEAAYRNATRMGRFIFIKHRQEFQDLLTEIIDFDDDRRIRLKEVLLSCFHGRRKFSTGANDALSFATSTLRKDILGRRGHEDIELIAIEAALDELSIPKLKELSLSESNFEEKSCVKVDEQNSMPAKNVTPAEINVAVLGNDLSESAYVEQRKILEVLVGSEWQLALGVLTRDYYLHVFITDFVTDESIFDYERVSAKALSQVLRSPNPDASVRLTSCEIRSCFDLVELAADGGVDSGTIDPRKITLIPKQNRKDGGRFSILRKKKTKIPEPDSNGTSELTIRLRSENEAWLLVNSIKCITTNSEYEAIITSKSG